jgi:hypothetical protein
MSKVTTTEGIFTNITEWPMWIAIGLVAVAVCAIIWGIYEVVQMLKQPSTSAPTGWSSWWNWIFANPYDWFNNAFGGSSDAGGPP